jgi:diaminopropionate ammonia-lyase
VTDAGSRPGEGRPGEAAVLGFRAVRNPLAGPLDGVTPPGTEVLAFHRRLPGYEPTPLLSAPALARRLGVRELLVKWERARLGLPAFKMLGASWATYRALNRLLRDRLGEEPPPWDEVAGLAGQLAPLLPLRLVAATDGNHGRAVARMARLLRVDCRIFVPSGTAKSRIDAIASEGAAVEVVNGGYDDAVARSAAEAGDRSLVISDTSWEGYADVPRWVIEGYATMFSEVDESLRATRRSDPDLVVVPVGVGALAAASVVHYRGPGRRTNPAILGVEPAGAACVTESVVAGRPVSLEGEQHSIMAGLNCGTPSPVAWPLVSRGVDAFVAIDDEWARRAVRDLAGAGIEAGETGAAAYGGLLALSGRGATTPLDGLLHDGASALVLVTEGATDLAAWFAILGVELVG